MQAGISYTAMISNCFICGELILVINRTIKQVSKHLFCNNLVTDLLQYFNRYNTRHLLAESLLSGDWQQTEFLITNTKFQKPKRIWLY